MTNYCIIIFNNTQCTEDTANQNTDHDELETDILPPAPKIQSFREALVCLKYAKGFLEFHSAFEEASLSSTLIDKIAILLLGTYNTRQTTLDDFF